MTKKIMLQLNVPNESEEITVDIDRKNFNQDEIANFMENSINISYLSKENDYIPISKEDVRFLDINKHKLKIKMNTKVKALKERETNINKHLNFNSSGSSVATSGSGSGSGVCWYGLDLI